MDPERCKKVVQALAGAFKGLRLYPLQHPAITRQIESLHTDFLALLGSRDTVRMGLLEGTLFIEDHLFTESGPAAEDIARLLEELDIGGLEFSSGLATGELHSLLGLMQKKGIGVQGLQNQLASAGIQHIRAVESEPEEETPRQIYGRALKVMDTIFSDVRMGRIPSSLEALDVVKGMARLTLADPHALFALSMLKDYDNYTFTHSVNVSVLALAVGRACGLSEEKLRVLGFGGLLHDLGKLRIHIDIITKPGRLTDVEFEEIKQHPVTGADIVTRMEGVTQEVIDIVLGHHLRYDQAGYPADVRGRKMSPLTDMAAIADTYDAITTLRSYQRPLTPRKATERLRKVKGSALHPEYTEIFIESLGTYPVGSLVRLDNNVIGLVVWVSTRDPDTVELKILFDGEGRKLSDPRRLKLDGSEAKRIVAEVDPFVKGIEVTDYFE